MKPYKIRRAIVAGLILFSQPIALAQAMPICGDGRRVTCVVDGDTFWLDRTKYRIADIDAPEVGRPGCPAELALGRQATLRLAELLVDGRFEVQPTGLDKVGRTLAIVNRDGRSIGMELVRERLAQVWGGPVRNWC